MCTDGENRCFTNENTGFEVISTLFMRGGYVLGIGSSRVNCTVFYTINDSFRNDDSFHPNFGQMTESTVLKITTTGKSLTM